MLSIRTSSYFITTAVASFITFNGVAQDTAYKRRVTVVKDTTVMVNYDTTVSERNCIEDNFGAGEKISNPSKISLVTKAKKTVTLNSFIQQLNMTRDHALIDMDKDGKKELIIFHYTGGAHCCDELFLFRNIATNKYQYVVKLFAGNVCMNEKPQFIYDFYEQFGYFFTCYACAFTDTTEAAPMPVSYIKLNYSKGKLSVVPGDKELRGRIRDNLAKLGEQPYENLEDDIAQDNGLRKEFALNLAVFYYSYGRNLVETKKLFDQFYKYPDAKKVWLEFSNHLKFIKKENDF
jgi:hypothetical protein